MSNPNGREMNGMICFDNGMNSSYKEISNSLNVPPKCVDNALTRIRKKANEVYKS